MANGILTIATVADLGTTSELEIGAEAAEDVGETGLADEAGTDAAQQDGTCLTGPAVGGMSFTAGTGVLLANGKTARIAALKPGDKVQVRDTEAGKNQPEAITAVEVHHDTDLYNLAVRADGHIQVIHTTASHLFYDPCLDKFIPAKQLKTGEHLKTPEAEALPVANFSEAAHPGIADNLAEYLSGGGSPIFTRQMGRSLIRANRRAAQRGAERPPVGMTWEEAPFASTREGGKGAILTLISRAENDSQGGFLSNFYNANKIGNGDRFYVTVDGWLG